jgi:hypothetical protein
VEVLGVDVNESDWDYGLTPRDPSPQPRDPSPQPPSQGEGGEPGPQDDTLVLCSEDLTPQPPLRKRGGGPISPNETLVLCSENDHHHTKASDLTPQPPLRKRGGGPTSPNETLILCSENDHHHTKASDLTPQPPLRKRGGGPISPNETLVICSNNDILSRASLTSQMHCIPLSSGEGLGAAGREPLAPDGVRSAVRLGFRQIRGLRLEDIQLLLEKRTKPFTCINDLRDAGISDAVLERLADADAFRSLGLDRRQALWEVSTKDRPQNLFVGQQAPDGIGESVVLPTLRLSEHVVQDYASLSLSLKDHPVHFVRPELEQLRITTARDLATMQNGQPVKVAGLVLVRQRPGTAKGIWFMTIEDETGCANLVLFPNIIEQYRKGILSARLFMAEGRLQKEGDVIHVIVEKAYDISKLLRRLVHPTSAEPNLLTLSRADEKPGDGSGDQRVEKKMPGSRDFK